MEDTQQNLTKPVRSIAIFGSADIQEADPLYTQAFEAAKLLAGQGYRLVNGGGPGIMQAVTEGAHAGGGKVLTISFEPQNAPYFEGNSSKNHADGMVMAVDYTQRVGLLISNSDAFVIFKGGTGTISEWALVWLMAHIYYGQHKPFILVGEFWREIIDVMKKHLFIEETETRVFRVVSTNEEILPALAELEKEKAELQQTQDTPGAQIDRGEKPENAGTVDKPW